MTLDLCNRAHPIDISDNPIERVEMNFVGSDMLINELEIKQNPAII